MNHLQRSAIAVAVLVGGVLGVAVDVFTEPPDTSLKSGITQVWANDGGDKVTQDELRAAMGPSSVINSVWDGNSINIFGARNETVSFNFVLEAAAASAAGVSVSLPRLDGPGGNSISTVDASGDGIFNYLGRNIELFYVRYLQIKGLSVDLAYGDYDERHIPKRCRRPWSGVGEGTGSWSNRPCHDKYYPEIAVPMELATPFNINAGTNQSIWCDIYIPPSTPAGLYSGSLTITENRAETRTIAINLTVRDFSLPDLPTARTMLYYSQPDIDYRYLGEAYPEEGSALYLRGQAIADRHFQMAHRHKISLISDYETIEEVENFWSNRLNGQLFTPSRGYEGPGIGVGNNVYSIGTYGSWPWQEEGQTGMRVNSNAWVEWFEAQSFSTPTEYFLYLVDESDDFAQTEQWAGWLKNNSGAGSRLRSMATIALPDAYSSVPSLDIPTSLMAQGLRDAWQNAAGFYRSDPVKSFYYYNGMRPASGTFAVEDDGAALRVNGWVHHKMGIDRWFYWDSTYYQNYQCYGYTPQADTNVFQQAQTYGCFEYMDDSLGQAGWNYFNGDGVLFYPGTDAVFPAESYGVAGPIASLRLKHWRRGLQDMEYLALAAKIDPARTAAIVQRMIPKVLWENGVSDPQDPTYVYCDVSWPTDPDLWEAARAELAVIMRLLRKSYPIRDQDMV